MPKPSAATLQATQEWNLPVTWSEKIKQRHEVGFYANNVPEWIVPEVD